MRIPISRSIRRTQLMNKVYITPSPIHRMRLDLCVLTRAWPEYLSRRGGRPSRSLSPFSSLPAHSTLHSTHSALYTLSTCTHCWKQMATQSSCEASHCSWLISPSAAKARIGSSITYIHTSSQRGGNRDGEVRAGRSQAKQSRAKQSREREGRGGAEQHGTVVQ